MFTPHAFAVRALSVVALTLLATACDSANASPAARRVYSDAHALGKGTVRTFVTVDPSGTPQALGVAISESAMGSLPSTPMPGMPSAAMLVMPVPAQGRSTGFDHVMFDWNPAGHEPDHVYTLPHFDFHFFTTTSVERESMVPSNPAWAAKVGAFPAADLLPDSYAAVSTLTGAPPAAVGVPLMGMHWLDRGAPELQPAPSGKPFTTTLIYGTWDGKLVYVEPMITKATIEASRNSAVGVRNPIALPRRIAPGTALPAAYSIQWDGEAGEYRITLEDLVAHR